MAGPLDHLGFVELFPVDASGCKYGCPLLGSAGQVKVQWRRGKKSVFAEAVITEPAVTCSAR